MHLNSRQALIARLRRGKSARKQFVESHLAKSTAYQLRATRERRKWSQEQLAREVGMNQNAISRLESPDYGKATITTLKRLASALDVALVVRLVPFSELVDWVSGTPRVVGGLVTEALAVPSFDVEEEDGVFGDALVTPVLAHPTDTPAGTDQKTPETDRTIKPASAASTQPVRKQSLPQVGQARIVGPKMGHIGQAPPQEMPECRW